jgi:hypothetical protein
MKSKIPVIVFVVIALVIAILSLMSDQNSQMYAAYATHFFVSIIPVLGTAALLKYIMCCGSSKSQGCSKDCKCCCNTSKTACEEKKEGSCNL